MRRHGAALTIYDARGREAGSLLVELRDPAVSAEQGLPTSPPIADPIQDPDEDSDGGILGYLRQAVEKTKIAADLLHETAEVRAGFIA
jgi:hypothetical protein